MKKRQKCKSISEYLRTFIAKLGRKIGQHPYYFIIVPCIMCALLSIGLINTKFIGDNNYLLVPDSGKIHEVKQFIDKTFPFNTSELYDFQRLTHRPKTAAIYIKEKNNRNMLQKNILLEIQSLNEIARNVTVYADGRQIGYKDICGMTYGKCFENPISGLLNNLDDVISKRLKIKYPIDIDPLTFTYKIMFLNVGGVTLDADGYIKEVSALRLLYPLDENNSTKIEWNVAWTEALFKLIKEHNFKYIETFSEPFSSSEYETMLNTQNSKSLISVTIIVICIFCILSNMTNSWTRSKPWMGVASIISTGMAVTASFGLLFACGVENIIYNIAIPFVILATEIDDTFVVIACWRTSNIYDRVEKRMEDTYSNAAVSITITSLTNFCSYCVAMNSPFPGVRIFCAYAATCICFSYFFQLTFVGGCLALSGYREENGLHPFTFKPVKDLNINYCTNEDIEHHDIFMKFFKNKVAEFISHSLIQIIIILLYIITLSLGIWGIISLKEGFNVFTFFPDNSEFTQAFRVYYKYFTEYPFSIHIIINETLDYSNPIVQKSIEDILEKFESHPNVEDMDISWLKYYKDFQHHSAAKYSFMGYDLSIKQDFIDALRKIYLKFPGAKMYKNDIVFNNNYTEIICSRFFLLARNVSNRITELKIINDLQKIAEESSFPVIVHTMISPFVEQGIIIKAVSFQFFWITSVIILAIFICFIPNLLYAFIVSLCISSITVQTIGFMSLWGINLDIVSLMCIILCIGFCVNYPTHICYSFVTSPNKTIKGKLKDSLYHVGFPIFQGAFSTSIGLLILLYYNFFLSITFVKIVIIIAVETAFHALFVIPVILSTVLSLHKKFQEKEKHLFNLALSRGFK